MSPSRQSSSEAKNGTDSHSNSDEESYSSRDKKRRGKNSKKRRSSRSRSGGRSEAGRGGSDGNPAARGKKERWLEQKMVSALVLTCAKGHVEVIVQSMAVSNNTVLTQYCILHIVQAFFSRMCPCVIVFVFAF